MFGLQNTLNAENVLKCVLTQINISAQQEHQIKPRNKLEWNYEFFFLQDKQTDILIWRPSFCFLLREKKKRFGLSTAWWFSGLLESASGLVLRRTPPARCEEGWDHQAWTPSHKWSHVSSIFWWYLSDAPRGLSLHFTGLWDLASSDQ